MQRYFYLFTFCLLAATSYTQNGLIGTGFAPGWNNPADILSFSSSAEMTRILTVQAPATGDRYFRLVRSWNGDNTEFGPFDCNDFNLTGRRNFDYQNMGTCSNGAFYINVPDITWNYVFKTPTPDVTNEFIYFEIQGPVRSIFAVEQQPEPNGSGMISSTATVLVGATLNDVISSGQGVYLRYTTNDFTTSTVVPMDDAAAGFFFSGEIPAQPSGTTITYYVFTSGDGVNATPLADGGDADYRTINRDDNNGNFYVYTTDIALPVTYRAWAGTRQTEGVQLIWATATETGAGYFQIECSSDNGRNWDVRIRLPAANSATGADYAYLDRAAPAASLQYRLRQVDLDGAFSYSSILSIAGKSAASAIRVWPQPAGGKLYLDLPADLTDARVELFDLTGKRVSSRIIGSSTEPLDVSILPRGTYLLRVSGGREVITRRIVLQ